MTVSGRSTADPASSAQVFQEILLRFSNAVAEGAGFPALIRLFCQTAKTFFGVSGVYYWNLEDGERLVAVDAEGHMAAEFLEARLQLGETAVATEAVAGRRTVFFNHLEADRYPMAARFGARAMLAAPLVVGGEVIGVAVLLHNADADFFNADLASKATILASQLGSMIEVARGREASLEERERAVHLMEITHALQSTFSVETITVTLVGKVRALLDAAFVVLYAQGADGLETRAVATDGVPDALGAAQAETLAHAEGTKLPATIASELPAAISFDASLRAGVVPFGDAIAVRVKMARSHAILLVCFRPAAKVQGRDFRLLGSLAASAGLILANAELYSTTEQHRNRAENLVKLGLELSSSLNLPEFVKSFTLRAADMLGAHAAALVLAQGATLETVFLHHEGAVTDRALPRRLTQALLEFGPAHRDIVSSGSAAGLLGAGVANALGWNDICIVRLAGASEEFLGYLCLAELRRALSAEEHELLRAVSGHVSVALENSRLFTRIAQSNKQWAEIFDAISDFIVVHDESNRVLRVNRSLAELIGVRPSELIGVSMRTLVSIAAEPSPLPCPFCRAGMETVDEYIHPVLERTYLVSTSRMHGALNEGLQTIHVLKDITDRREVERRYRELFDNTQEGIFFSTPDGRFIEVNDALVKMLGYSRQELLEIDIPTSLYLQPGDRLRFKQLIEARGTVRNYQEVLRRKDGTLIHTLQNSFAVTDANGNVLQYRGMILDITELKTFQSQLQHERDFNSKILNNTQSMILVSDTAGLISYANRRCFEAGGFQESELLGNRLLELVTPARRPSFAEAFDAVISGQQVDNLELPIQRSSGQAGHFSLNLSPMRDDQGNVTSIVVVMTDITDAALLNAKLMHAEKMAAVGQLVSGVAHEVNNPLTAIMGFADLLLQQQDVPESAKKDLFVIVQESQRTRQIVRNLLSFARPKPAERKPIDVNAILQSTLQLRTYDFSSHGVDVVERLQEDLPEIVGDAHQLQQVFLNILNNAYDAVCETGRRGSIEVSTSARNGMVEVSFADNGAGIAHPDRIFDPFFTTKEVGKGTGLGLSICYGIVREHGGEISCTNREQRPGATFVVRLPLAAVAVAGAHA